MKKFKNGQGKLKKAQRIANRANLRNYYAIQNMESKAGIKYTKLVRNP